MASHAAPRIYKTRNVGVGNATYDNDCDRIPTLCETQSDLALDAMVSVGLTGVDESNGSNITIVSRRVQHRREQAQDLI